MPKNTLKNHQNLSDLRYRTSQLLDAVPLSSSEGGVHAKKKRYRRLPRNSCWRPLLLIRDYSWLSVIVCDYSTKWFSHSLPKSPWIKIFLQYLCVLDTGEGRHMPKSSKQYIPLKIWFPQIRATNNHKTTNPEPPFHIHICPWRAASVGAIPPTLCAPRREEALGTITIVLLSLALTLVAHCYAKRQRWGSAEWERGAPQRTLITNPRKL